MKKNCVIVLLLILLSSSVCFALEKTTHEKLNEFIATNSLNGFSLDVYLRNQLGFANGIKEEFKLTETKKVWEWIKLGGSSEDEPFYTRSFNHFHNPLLSWDQAGFGGTFKSAILWAQDQGSFGSLFGGNYSWKAVRDYYYLGLTSSTKTEREKNLADTFRGLGQLMHLVEDMSVPAHTRNDAHVIGYHYEKAVEKIRTSGDETMKKIYNDAVANPITFDPSILVLASNPLAPIPIAKIFDTDKYDESTAVSTLPSGTTFGLAEYTNANFFSEETIFKGFSHPAKENTNAVLTEQQAKDGKLDKIWYIYKNGDTSGKRLAAYSYFWINSGFIPKTEWLYNLDDNVYSDYAYLLLPRAVGYSAGLLNYFFRGNFRITNVSYDSTSITMWVMNKTYIDPADPVNSAIEPMGPGSLIVSYSYKDNQGNTIYGLSNAINVNTVPSVKDNMYIPATFPLNSPIPSAASDVSFILIFRGVLGNESDAIAAKRVFTPPTRIAYYHQPGGGGIGNNSYIYSIDPDGQNITQLTNDSDGYQWDFSPALSPDGTKLAFLAENSLARDIIAVDLTSPNAYPGNIIRIMDSTPAGSSSTYSESSPSWSPDGSEIATTRWQEGSTDTEIIIFNLATGQWRQITSGEVSEWIQTLSWSPAGDKIVYSANTSESGTSRDDIFVINTDGSNRINLTNDNYADISPSWSPDGTQILFSSNRDGGSIYDLWVMDVSGTNLRQISNYTQNSYSSAGSPDGEQGVFRAGTWYSELYVMDIDGTFLYQLTNDGYTGLNSSPSLAIK